MKTQHDSSASLANLNNKQQLWDQPATSTFAWLLFSFAFVIFLPYFVLAIPVTSGPNGTLGPPIPGDSQDYDSIALNLARGRGFGQFHDDPEWRTPYETHNQSGMYDDILTRQGGYRPTAYRPPGYPIMLSVIYRTVGRSFVAARLANALLLALAVSLTVMLAGRYISPRNAFVVMIVALTDGVLKSFAGAYMTEAMAICSLVIALWALLIAIRRPSVWRLLVAGGCIGLLILVRSLFVLWVPLLLVLVGCLAELTDRKALFRRCGIATVFLLGILAVLAPWWVRNCYILDGFMPLGTQGGNALVAAYSDDMIENRGHWSPITAKNFLAVNSEVFANEHDPLVLEREQSRMLKAHAFQWLTTNYYQLPKLAVLKLVAHWLPGYDFVGGLIRVLAIVGCVCGIRSGFARLCLGLLIIDSLAIAATYEDYHRFMAVMYPVLYLLASIGVLHVTSFIAKKTRTLAAHD